MAGFIVVKTTVIGEIFDAFGAAKKVADALAEESTDQKYAYHVVGLGPNQSLEDALDHVGRLLQNALTNNVTKAINASMGEKRGWGIRSAGIWLPRGGSGRLSRSRGAHSLCGQSGGHSGRGISSY